MYLSSRSIGGSLDIKPGNVAFAQAVEMVSARFGITRLPEVAFAVIPETGTLRCAVLRVDLSRTRGSARLFCRPTFPSDPREVRVGEQKLVPCEQVLDELSALGVKGTDLVFLNVGEEGSNERSWVLVNSSLDVISIDGESLATAYRGTV